MHAVPRLITTFTPTHYDISLDIDRPGRSFCGVVTVEGRSSIDTATISLHTKDLEIESVTVDGETAVYALGEHDELVISPAHSPADRDHIVVVSYRGIITPAMHGLYPSTFEHDGVTKELLATQCESHHARELFPCIDEPEAKATFAITLTTEPDVTVLGNMPVRMQRQENGKLVTSFEPTPRMSSYLVAFVIGELHKRTATTKRGVEVSVWATPAQSADSLDFALDVATRTIDFFEEYFGVEYPLPKSDHVALPDFSSGAMENWGLITYREIALLADPATTSVSSRRYIATVVAHELSHQWFGNLVTMKWWNNLWLNESFATLMEYIAVDALYPEWDIWMEFSANESVLALRRDALDGVQPVQVEVNHPDEISTLFDGAIVYAKGARLLRMCERYVGKDAFRRGLGQYFKQYAYSNTEGDDLWHALAEASGKDITSLMNTWISQPGYPVVSVSADGLAQEQFYIGQRGEGNRLWPIPLGASSSEDVPAMLETRSLNFPITPGERLNVGDSAHFITKYDDEFMTALLASTDTAPLDRLQLLHEATLLTRGGLLASAKLLPLLESYADETAEPVWNIISLTISELKKFVETDPSAEQALRQLAGRIAERQYQRLGWDTQPGEVEADTKLRAIILSLMLYSENSDVIAAAKQRYDSAPLDQLDGELRPLIISSVVRHHETPQLIEQLLTTYRTTHSADLQTDIAVGLTATKTPATIATLLGHLTDAATIRAQDTARWFVYLIRGREARALTWQWLQDNWTWIESTFSGDKSYDDFPRYAASGLVTREQLQQYQQFFTPMTNIPALSRVIAIGIGEITARVELIERDGKAVRQALRSL